MERFKWHAEKEKRRKESLERHNRLHELFVKDRLGFERERRRFINEFLNEVEDKELRNKLQALQESWDTKMRHAGSNHNRFVLAQTIFWSHFYDKWCPAIQRISSMLNST